MVDYVRNPVSTMLKGSKFATEHPTLSNLLGQGGDRLAMNMLGGGGGDKKKGEEQSGGQGEQRNPLSSLAGEDENDINAIARRRMMENAINGRL
jgi:hypothetical protein